jgi:histidinol-phosphatase
MLNQNYDALDALSHEQWLELLVQLADEADVVSRHYFESVSLKVMHKDDKTPVSEADIEIERIVRKSLLSRFPQLGVIGEEFESCEASLPYKLIIDPIDGTSNFIRNIPIFGTLMAIEKHGKIIAGLVSNGFTRERWSASKGSGAFYNGKAIRVSTIETIEKSQGFYGSLFGNEARGDFHKLTHLLSKTKRQRGIGDFLMHMWVANGYGEFGIDFGLKPWDIAPLGIIVQEAGGHVTQVDGSEFSIYTGSILTSNNLFHDQIVLNYC